MIEDIVQIFVVTLIIVSFLIVIFTEFIVARNHIKAKFIDKTMKSYEKGWLAGFEAGKNFQKIHNLSDDINRNLKEMS